MTIQGASDPSWEIRATTPDYTKWAGENEPPEREPPDLPPDKRPGSEGPHIRPRN